MINNDKKINRNMIIGWFIIASVLLVAYFGEYIKGTRSLEYILCFYAATVLPPALCTIKYSRNPNDKNLRYFILAGYFIMYAFVLITGSTMMVFTYILPMLSLMVLYHRPMLNNPNGTSKNTIEQAVIY